jgi:hypothetical protein
LGPRKTKCGIKISRRGIIRSTAPREMMQKAPHGINPRHREASKTWTPFAAAERPPRRDGMLGECGTRHAPFVV